MMAGKRKGEVSIQPMDFGRLAVTVDGYVVWCGRCPISAQVVAAEHGRRIHGDVPTDEKYLHRAVRAG